MRLFSRQIRHLQLLDYPCLSCRLIHSSRMIPIKSPLAKFLPTDSIQKRLLSRFRLLFANRPPKGFENFFEEGAGKKSNKETESSKPNAQSELLVLL